MPSIFSRVIAGELPGRFVHEDEQCVGMLTIAPLRPGHTLVIPREEIDHWLDLPEPLAAHLVAVARRIGRAIDAVWSPVRVGLVIAGLEVPHVHLHVFPVWTVDDFNFANVAPAPDPAALDEAATKIRAALA